MATLPSRQQQPIPFFDNRLPIASPFSTAALQAYKSTVRLVRVRYAVCILYCVCYIDWVYPPHALLFVPVYGPGLRYCSSGGKLGSFGSRYIFHFSFRNILFYCIRHTFCRRATERILRDNSIFFLLFNSFLETRMLCTIDLLSFVAIIMWRDGMGRDAPGYAFTPITTLLQRCP